MNSRPQDAIRLWPMSYTKEGRPQWTPHLTSIEDKAEKILPCPPDKVIPIIFVPGIMGSNLKQVGGKEKIAWRPDDMWVTDAFIRAKARQKKLSPRDTVVDDRIAVKGDKETKQYVDVPSYIPIELAQKRGWGSIFWKSYGDFITWLELHGNKPVFFDFHNNKQLVNAIWQPLLDGVKLPDGKTLKLTREELEKVGDYHFPVWCVGYNWLQSNKDSGKHLATKIQAAIDDAKGLFGAKAAKKVILITHSMGGLVARAACHPQMGGKESQVLGVIHGVQPAIGAAAAYRRMRAGFESGMDAVEGFKQKATAYVTSWALGGTGEQVTCVLAHSPGGLQLLPTKRYMPEGWLKIGNPDGTYQTITGNPYQVIYREKTKWWRLINQEWLDPAKSIIAPSSPWTSFEKAIVNAEDFHNALDSSKPYYHPNTYAHHGSDEQHKAWADIKWLDAPHRTPYYKDPELSRLRADDPKLASLNFEIGQYGSATARPTNWVAKHYQLGPADAKGDGTVPAISGRDPGEQGVKSSHGLSGFDHQGSYSPTSPQTMMTVLHDLAKIVQQADW